MFASLKKKLQEEGGTSISGTKSGGSSTPTGAKASSVHSTPVEGKGIAA
jgi:hypothetical protein